MNRRGSGAPKERRRVKRRRMLVLTVSAVAMALVSACGGSGGGQAITVVIAEYSKDHTKPFWQGLAEQYTKQTSVKVDLRVIDWNSIDQQVSTMIQNNQRPRRPQPELFLELRQGRLLYSATDVLSPKTKDDFLEPFVEAASTRARCMGSRSCRAPARSSTTAIC
jgi:multiple sugar transport system substrate-binding protein